MNPRSEMGAGAPQGIQDGSTEAEETLRLVAKLPAPDGLHDRVQRRLDTGQWQRAEARRTVWSLWMPTRKLQYAGMGVLAAALAVSVWSVHRTHELSVRPANTPGATVGGGQPAQAKPGAASAGGFSTAGKIAVPHTLTPIKVPPAPKKNPAGKPSPKKIAKPVVKPE